MGWPGNVWHATRNQNIALAIFYSVNSLERNFLRNFTLRGRGSQKSITERKILC